MAALVSAFLPPKGPTADVMSYQGSRLASLGALPATCSVSRVRLAIAGFFYDLNSTTRDNDEVVCYSCGVRHGQWTKEDNPIRVHHHLNSDCPHLKYLNATNANSGQLTPLASRENAPSLRIESELSGEASSGLSKSSTVHAASDTGSVSEQPGSSHVSNSNPEGRGSASDTDVPNCAQTGSKSLPQHNHAPGISDESELATDCEAIIPSTSSHVTQTRDPLSANQQTTTSHVTRTRDTLSTNQQTPLESHDKGSAMMSFVESRTSLSLGEAVYPQFCTTHNRLPTFRDWPLSQYFRPQDLVLQGFYYAGYADCVRCFYCGVGLKSWAEHDDVMTEHIRWRPSCGFILHIKGRQFVDSVLSRLQE